MHPDELYHLLALQKVKNIGDISAKKLLKHFGSAQAIFEAAKNNRIDIQDIGTVMINSIKSFNDWQKVTAEIKYLEQNKIQVISIFDDNYPYKLQHAPDGPILFFYKGEADLNQSRVISIVGTRNITPYGKRIVNEIIEELAPYKPLIVSGLAYGVDVESHLNALKYNLPTVGVLGHGFQRIYPSIHQKIAHKMLEKGGLLTEFWHSDLVDRNNFLKRNRIVAGLSEATIIIESGEKGGSLVTADIANSYNRDVFAVPGRATDRFSIGCNNLIKRNQAALLSCGQDLIDMLQWSLETPKSKNPQLNLFVDLTDEEQQIFDYLQEKGTTSLDDLALELKMSISKIAQLLMTMELNGILTSLPGKKFELI